MAADSRTAAQARGVSIAARSFPARPTYYEKATLYRWLSDPWARGAFAAFPAGGMSATMPAAFAPAGLHVAGEPTPAWMGWMEGAWESGERAAAGVLAAGQNEGPGR